MSFKTLFSVLLSSMVLFSFGCSQQEGKESAEVEVSENGNPTDEELKKFVEAVQILQPMGMMAQQRMIAAVEEVGMTPQRFSEIMNAQQMGNDSLEITPAEQELYVNAENALNGIQEEIQAEMEEALEEMGFSMERYEEIMMMVNMDEELLEKVQNMLMAADEMDME
jgi:DNA mismatch repair ATPase MutL